MQGIMTGIQDRSNYAEQGVVNSKLEQQKRDLSESMDLAGYLTKQMGTPDYLAQALEEQQRLSQLGAGITSLIAGYPAQTQTQMTPSPSGLATGLGAASTLAGIYRLYKGPYG